MNNNYIITTGFFTFFKASCWHVIGSCLDDNFVLVLVVPKAASYAVGNAAYHSADLYSQLGAAVPSLVQLLTDPVGRTRCNAAGRSCFLMGHSTKFGHSL